MSPITIGIIVFACTLGGALAGVWLRHALPDHHLDSDAKDTVKVGFGLVITMTALILGLITASAKSYFDTMDASVKRCSVEFLTLDRILARYGDETKEIRKDLHRVVEQRLEMTWPQHASHSVQLESTATTRGSEAFVDRIQALTPKDERQKRLHAQALVICESLMQTRWAVFTNIDSSIPGLFLGILTFWLTVIFISVGLFAPWNHTVVAILFVCAFSVSGAIFLIEEMNGPFDGVIKVSAEPLRYALSRVNQ